jgi:hypothetical protein
MDVTGQLDAKGAEKLAARVGASYVIASVLGGAAALIYAVAQLIDALR